MWRTKYFQCDFLGIIRVEGDKTDEKKREGGKKGS